MARSGTFQSPIHFVWETGRVKARSKPSTGFPLPGDVAVYELLVKFGDTEIRSELKSLQTAKQEYFRAKEEGKSSALLTRESPNVFTLSITGISAGEDVTVTTRYYHVGTPEIPGFFLQDPTDYRTTVCTAR